MLLARIIGLGHSAGGVGGADTRGDVCAAGGGADLDGAQGLPDALLEGGAPHIEWQIEANGWRFDKAGHGGDHMLEVAVTANQCGQRRLVRPAALAGSETSLLGLGTVTLW